MRLILSVFSFMLIVSACKKTDAPQTNPTPSATDTLHSLSATALTTTGFQLNWVYNGTQQVQLFVARDSSFKQVVNGLNGLLIKETKFTVTGLSPDSAYFCQVKISNGPSTNILKVTTLPCMVSSIVDSATSATKMEFVRNAENKLIKETSFNNVNAVTLVSDIQYSPDGQISSIKETNGTGGDVFELKFQKTGIVGVGKISSTSLDTLQIEFGSNGLVRTLRTAKATALSSTDTTFFVVNQLFTYNVINQLVKVVQIEVTKRTNSTAVTFNEFEYTFQYINRNLVKQQEFKKNNGTGVFEELQTINYEYDGTKIFPTDLHIEIPNAFMEFREFFRTKTAMPSFFRIGSKNLVTKITTQFARSSETNIKTFIYNTQNSRFPKSVTTIVRRIRSDNGSLLQETKSALLYRTTCD